MSTSAGEQMSLLQEKLLKRKPILKEILEKNGDTPLCKYAHLYLESATKPDENRRKELLETVYEETERNLGPRVAQEVYDQLQAYYYVSTADHHGPICASDFIGSNLLQAVNHLDKKDPVLKHVISFACSNVSLHNGTFPRGLFFHDLKGELQRIAFFPKSAVGFIVYGLKPYTAADIDRVKKTLQSSAAKKEISESGLKTLLQLLGEVYSAPDVLNAASYSDQVTKTNFILWNKLFKKQELPSLVYLEQEGLVAKILLKHHIKQKTAIHNIIFDPSYESLLKKYFEGVYGAFSTEDKSGSYLFWALPKDQKYRLPLKKGGDHLVSLDGSYSIELNPEAIGKALADKELIPTALLDFMVLVFYYGLKCVGGGNQVNYLSDMKTAYIAMQTEKGDLESVKTCENIPTNQLCVDFCFTSLQSGEETQIPSGLDFMLYSSQDTWSKLVESLKTVHLEDAFYPAVPGYYSPYREEGETFLSAEEILKELHAQGKIKTFI